MQLILDSAGIAVLSCSQSLSQSNVAGMRLDKKVISREAILSVISNLTNKYGAAKKHKC